MQFLPIISREIRVRHRDHAIDYNLTKVSNPVRWVCYICSPKIKLNGHDHRRSQRNQE